MPLQYSGHFSRKPSQNWQMQLYLGENTAPHSWKLHYGEKRQNCAKFEFSKV